MSPAQLRQKVRTCRFPRVSGDEPAKHLTPTTPPPFSPRERG